jgi:hypothetical protein
MYKKTRNRILVVDKNGRYVSLFKGLRKNKFIVDSIPSLSTLSAEELLDFNLFFIVLYNARDVFDLLKVYKEKTPIVVASSNLKILKKMRDLGCFSVVDFSKKGNLSIELLDCIKQVFK